MWVRCKRACLLLIGLGLFVSPIWACINAVAAQDVSPWLVAQAPHLQKVVDLPDNLSPDSGNTDCSSFTYAPVFGQDAHTVCLFNSPLGTLTTDGSIQIGGASFARLEGVTKASVFVPTVDSTIAVMSIPSVQIGNNLGVYTHLSKSMLHADADGPDVYSVTDQPDQMLRNSLTHALLQVDVGSIAYSANGEWMVVDMPQQGLLRVHMSDLSTLLFAPAVEPSWYLGLATPPLAISNDGRFVAANTDTFGTGNIRVYDLSTCTDQLNVDPRNAHYCSNKDLWNSLLDQWTGMVRPVHIRFVNQNTISFSARYAVDSATGRHKTAVFTATAFGAPQHMLGLLGMGDSYISGQGAFVYRQGTDTATNACHLSELAYPFILGAQSFSSYNSVACSGAVTGDMVGKDPGYLGQVKDRIPESSRDKSTILSTFTPGNIYQQEFASTYLPEAIVLSVGGDDIHFSDIVKACVANLDGGTCYDTYEDRAELLGEINTVYAKLVNTYKTLRQQSGGARVYVVGYPQVVKPRGDCGLNVHLNTDETVFASQLVDYLDGVVERAAQTAGVFYVDVRHAFDGHLLCEAGTPAMNGLTAGNDAGPTIKNRMYAVLGAESYHPTQKGYELLADVIAQTTNRMFAPMPMPRPFLLPGLDANTPLLQDVPKTGRTVRQATTDNSIANDIVVQGDLQQVMVNGSDVQLRPGSQYQVVLHSTPVLLGEGSVDANGNVAAAVQIPADTVPGYHVLHVYGTNMAGEAVDIKRYVCVAASTDDDASEVASTVATQTDMGVATPSANQQLAATAPLQALSEQTATGTVLGQATTGGAQSQKRADQTANITLSTSAQKLFRLNWTIVLEVGVAWTAGATVLYQYVRRQ